MKNKKQEIFELLKIHYGYDTLRIGQEEAIDNVLNGKSCVVIMPTGGGKSLCYQLPALVLDGVTIVVSPLIALMKDQVDTLEKNNIPATFINSSISLEYVNKRLEEIKEGKYKLLYISPERFYNVAFIKVLNELEVSLFAIDEAHCISQWGHDFRPSYTRLKDAIKMLDNPPVIALTATATPTVKQDIVKQLDLVDPSYVITGFARPNLHFTATRTDEYQKPHLVLEAIQSLPSSSGIVYVSTRKKAEGLLNFLLSNGIESMAYHAGMEAEERKLAQENFLNNKVKVIIATNAFGLGIDKQNLRFVIHYDMPGTLEAYYQEAGRAGRDGKPSYCLMLYNSQDRFLQEFFIKGDNPPIKMIRELYEVLLSYEQEIVLATYAELAEGLSDKVPDLAISTAIKVLEKEKLIIRGADNKDKAFLKLLKPADEIKNSFTKRTKKQLVIFDKLLDLYQSDLENGVYFVPSDLAELLEEKKDSLSRFFKKLQKDNLLDYKPPFRGTEIKILQRLGRSEFEIDEDALKIKSDRAYNRLDKMESYLYTNNCRQKYILDYFEDPNSSVCGKCDNCVNKIN